MGIFAKFVFGFAYVFGGGAGQDLPILTKVTEPVPEIRQRIAAATVEIQCPAVPPGVVAPPCTPSAIPLGFQVFCMAPGVYTVTVRLGLLAQIPVGGKVWIERVGDRALVAAWNAAPGAPAYIAAGLQVQSPGAETCYRITVDANGPVEVIADPAVSFLTIGR